MTRKALSRLSLSALAALLAASSALRADEGMWMPQQIPDLAPKLKELGWKGDPKAFADLTGFPMGAIVSLGGCSASFVSPDGLIATNHHCVVGSLQYNSTPEKNLLENGFLAKTRAEELSNGPGSRVYVTTRVADVTAEITGKLPAKVSDAERYQILDRRVKERTAACEKDGSRCRVASFFEGMKYFEIAQMEVQDVRLVYAPASGIGNFGGETDNWQWPRHTGDWSFYRAYVGKDGKAAPFSKENVPFRPKHWLTVSTAGASPGDLVFVAGYPGRTLRHATYGEVKDDVEFAFPRSIKRAQDQLALLDDVAKGSKETEIKVASRKRGLANGLTNSKGKLEGLVKGGLLAEKEKLEKELVAWVNAGADRKAKYGAVLAELQALQAESAKTRERDSALGLVGGGAGGGSILGAATTLYRLSIEREKKDDLEREPEFQERNWTRTREALDRLDRSLDPKADRALFRYALLEAAKLPPTQRIAPLDAAVGLAADLSESEQAKAIDAFLDRYYAGTKLFDKATRLSYFDKKTSDLVAAKDSALELAAALHPLGEEVRRDAKRRQGARARLRPVYMEALLAKSGGLLAPDANGTLRVTFGVVKGVSPRDGLTYAPQTTLQGVVEKATGTGEFNAPKRQLDAIAALRAGKKTPYGDARLGDVPVNFLSTVDTTGGNSGSATLNAKGELCGLLFDGTYDTVASDYLYDRVKTRSIHVDSRYVLWTMTEVDGATHLLEEMGIQDPTIAVPPPTF